MGRLACCIAALLIAALPVLAAAQPPFVPAPPYYAIDPAGAPPRADNPVQQQILQNYRARLRQTERELLRQNPSGLGRDQLDARRQLNAFSRFVPPAPAPPP